MESIRIYIMKIIDTIQRRRNVILALSCLVVFITTYVLILPAFTLEKEQAAEQGGIDLPITKNTDQNVDADTTSENDDEITDNTIDESNTDDNEISSAEQTADVLTADGENYRITISYDESAEIPDGTQLVAKEIKQGTNEYLQHLGKAWAEVNKEYLEQEELIQNNQGGLDDYEYEDIRPVNLDDARFFNISLRNGGEEIEPKSPVHVEIQYVDGLETDKEKKDQVVGVAHYKDGVTELDTDVDTERNDAGEIVELNYDQDSLSDVGTFVGQETFDNVPYEMNASLAMPKLKALANGNGNGLDDIEAHKNLTNNNDGTYTMSLTVKGDSAAYEEYTKANVLFVMDRSSSMSNPGNDIYTLYTGEYQTGTTYYGKNGNNYFTLAYSNGQYYHLDYWGNPQYWNPYNGDIYTRQTRLQAEQAAMDVLIQDLLAKNDPNTPGKEDLIEISVISFAEDRCSGNTEYTNWTSSDYNGLMAAINQTTTPSGTNWEDALIYAKETADAKKAQQPDEDVYVIFLTDGEPTAVYGEHDGAQHYISSSTGEVLRGGFEYALTETPRQNYGINDGKNALDRAKEIVDGNLKFYGIFTFNPGEAQTRYLRRLMNFAYTGVDKAYENDATKEDTDIVKKYFTNADTPEALTEAFEKIFADVSNTLGHGDVVITDGLTSADAMTTTIHANKADGFRYSVTDDTTGEELYYVTATGNDSNPAVTFHIDGQEYPAGDSKTGVDGKPYYSVTVSGTEYKMALADLSGRELKWDLSAIGTLLPDCTYKVDIIVWPNQAAYDYVAGLNNNLPGYTWDESVESNPENYHEVTAGGETYGYYTGGVEEHPSIVKYKDSGVFSVLTNTHQELNYSIVNTKTNEVTGETTMTSDPQEPIQLEPQKPMDLVDTNSSIEKIWSVGRDPSILAQLLYGGNDHYSVTFDILQDDDPDTDADDETNRYTSVTLGWDPSANEGQGAYVWDPESVIDDVEYNGQTYSIGTRWVGDFSIASGLALSAARMDALGLDKNSYRSAEYNDVTYYILEDGHDYTIKELSPRYEFDFISPVYHPMVVDGVLMSVNVTKDNEGKINGITKMEQIAVDEDGTSSLRVENTLRGYLHLNKVVVDAAGNQVKTDDNKFEFIITLNDKEGRFTGEDIPWYGINGMFYHDEDFNYYQAENIIEGDQIKPGVLSLKDEQGDTYTATCSGTFDPDTIGPTEVTYTDKSGNEKTIQLYGNQTSASDNGKIATATMEISQAEVLNIANIPAGTTYTITESQTSGYELKDIAWEIKDGDTVEPPGPDTPAPEIKKPKITGTIITNRDNHVTYTNTSNVADITIRKLDENDEGLEGAVFQLVKVGEDGHSVILATDIGSVRGLGSITKGTETYDSSIETTGDVQKISGLPDGTYRLSEKYVPAGYISTWKYIEFTVEDRVVKDVKTDTGVIADEADDLAFTPGGENTLALVTITNEAGAELPSSGGIGTTIFYILGSLLAVGCGVVLISRRRIRSQ